MDDVRASSPTTPFASCVDRIARACVVAVVRAPDAERGVAAGEVLAEAGLRAVEIAFTTPDAARAIERLRERCPDLLIGAGSVCAASQVGAAHDAGADFLVSPHHDPALREAADERGLLHVSGALSPTELLAASADGRPVKLFPGDVGGPAYLRAVLGPFPELRAMPTGGVTAANARNWLAAGAFALGAGGDLCSTDLITRRAYPEIAARADAWVAATADPSEVAG